jgi:hypothetical protein
MSGDSLVYDMASMSEGSPNIFVKKDWLNILDNQNGNYQGNQSVIDTSQLANSNKYMNYREAYLAVPMVLTATNATVNEAFPLVAPATAATSADSVFGLKNWFGSIVHSFTLDYNGTTIVQQTPYVGMWNNFRLITTLSQQDLVVNGAEMGFYPDDPLAFGFADASNNGVFGIGTYNNQNLLFPSPLVSGQDAGFSRGNVGLSKRQSYIAYDPAGITGGSSATGAVAYSSLLTDTACIAQFKSYINRKVNAGAAAVGTIQYSIMATIRLKHLHNFFQNVPLLKGVFMKMTLNLNQSSVVISTSSASPANTYANVSCVVNSPLGGVSPIMIAGGGGSAAATTINAGLSWNSASKSVTVSLAVGNRPILAAHSALTTSFPSSIQLYVPAYTFNPVYESAYLSNPIKKVAYTDIYQYQVLSVGAGATFNNLLTNGISNIKSVLILPFYTTTANAGLSPILSPFTGEGAGTTSPLTLLTNFNVVVAGQNMIYNTQKYSYEQFLHQLQGANAINADMTDGLTSGLIDKLGFEHQYCYYYVNCSRMLPVEESVPKSVSIVGQNSCSKAIDLFCFIEYGVEVSLDVLTGARV